MHQCDILFCYVSNCFVFFIGNIKQHQQQTNNNNKPSCISNMDGSDENISKKEEDRNDEDELRQPFGC